MPSVRGWRTAVARAQHGREAEVWRVCNVGIHARAKRYVGSLVARRAIERNSRAGMLDTRRTALLGA
jgi:hypothetical protein